MAEILVMAFKDNLVRLRKGRGWTQVELAEKAGITVGLVRRYEAGGTSPNLPTLRRLAESLGTSTDELVFEPGGLPAKRLDHALFERFEAISRLPAGEQEAIRFILDAVIANQELKQVLRSQTQIKAKTSAEK
jgi:transcriptional regulator with XRE-family HTH domain